MCIRDRKYADQNQQLLAWAITLIKTNFEQLKNIFPIVPNDRSMNWALRTARVFISLKNALREGGLNISDVSENKEWDFGDTSRWKELSRLEQCFESSLQKNGTTHKTIIGSKPDNLVHQIKNIILIVNLIMALCLLLFVFLVNCIYNLIISK